MDDLGLGPRPGHRESLPDLVAAVRFELSGAGLGNPLSLDVSPEQFIGSLASAKWDDLPPGDYRVRAVLLDHQGRKLAEVEEGVTIESGKVAELDLVANVSGGSALVRLDVPGPTPPPDGLVLLPPGRSPRVWEPFAPLAAARLGVSTAVVGGAVYAIGGAEPGVVERLDPSGGKWVPVTFPEIGALDSPGHAVGLNDHIVVIDEVHEVTDTSRPSETLIFGPLPARIAGPEYRGAVRVPATLEPRAFSAAVAAGDRVLVVGGSSRRRLESGLEAVLITSAGVEALSIKDRFWSRLASLPTPRAALAAAVIDGNLFAAGGFRWEGGEVADPIFGGKGMQASTARMAVLDQVEAYDLKTDSWRTCASLPTARHSFALAVSHGRLYAMGGASLLGTALAKVESYSPATDTWRLEPPMTIPRASFGATVLGDGTILAIGGASTDGRPLRTVESYFPGDAP